MPRISSIALALVALTTVACGESREEKIRKQLAYDTATPQDDGDDEPRPSIPPHPVRDALAPVLTKIYAADSLPDVQETAIAVEGQDYTITNPGVLAIVNIKSGMSKADQAKAIIKGVAEADGFAVRKDAELYFPEQLNKIKFSFSEEQRDLIRSVYGDLRLLDFFASEAGAAAIGELDGELQAAVNELKQDYLGRKDEIWAKWMSVKMFARRVVAYDQPFKSILRTLRKSFDMKEPEPISWDDAHDPAFAAWAKTINGDDELFKMLTNLAQLREQEEFRGDTHARWTIEGSAKIPDVARKVKIDPELGFGVHREDLGGGYQEMTFVFSKKLQGNALKEAYLRSLIYRQVFTDFATLSAAGGDFEEGQVPDKHDPDYAYCASRMALDGMINDYGSDKPLLAGLSAKQTNEDKLVSNAVDCVLSRIPSGINRGVEGDEARPPAMSTRTAFFQMLARFTKVDVNLDNMKKDVQKSQEVLDAEALLKEHDKKRREAGG
ncbi:MAG TPA: hypothetical protein VK034_19040 [Enhygromyxa sp.]|nr:hypothetical protein [Enhygromyxa sp.]